MQTCTEKVSLFGDVKSLIEYLQSLRSVTSLYKNMHLHGNPGSSDKHPTGKQGVELCCSPRGVVLYGGCPERQPCLPRTL